MLLQQITKNKNLAKPVIYGVSGPILTDEEKYLLLESGVGEGIFFAGLKHVAIKIISSYTEDQIITSDPSQILSIKKAKDDVESAEIKK